ncbi:MAG: hypothetical protein HY962_06255 [Ignavibacteriae bacterium]|nr:hypothetical protein [Ignavibacteriota bacterium]
MITTRQTFRHILLALCFSAAALSSARAQGVSATLNVSPRPNPYLSEWAARKETAMLTTTVPPGGRPVQVKFSVEVKKDGAVQARTKTEQMSIVTLPPGVSVYYAEALIPFRAVDFVGGAKNTAAKTGMLPAGDYEFCVDLLDPQTGQSIIGAPICRGFYVTGYDAPKLLFPDNGSALQTGERPMFRWAPVTPQPQGFVTYRVMVFEVLQGQRAMQAFRGNRPILDVPVRGVTQLLWPPEYPLPGRVPEYAWTVRALDERGTPLGETDGYAQPFTFTVAAAAERRATAGETATIERRQGNEALRTQQPPAPPVDVAPGPLMTAQKAVKAGPGDNNVQQPDTTQYGNGNPQPAPSGCQPAGVTPPPVVDQTPSTKAAAAYVDSVVTVGYFPMKILEATGTGAGLTGKGSILVTWLRTPVAVQFTNIKINTAGQVYNGDVVARIDATPDPYQTQWLTNVVGGLPWTKTRIKNLETWLKANFGKLTKDLDLNTQIANATNSPVLLPLGITNLKGYTVAIAEMKWNAAGAELVGVMSLPVLEHNDDLGFKTSGLAFAPSGPSFQSGSFGLLGDVTFSPDTATWSVTFKAPTDTANGTFIDWDCDGFRRAQVDMDFALPRAWVTPSPDNGQKVKTNVKAWISDWDDWIVNATLPKSTITNTNGTDLEVTNMAYDHSDIRNPSGITFPAGYTGDQTMAFQGFFIKQAKLLLPEKLTTFDDPTKRVTIFVNNLIVNKTGVTCAIGAANIIQFPKGNIASLGASIDSLKISLVNSSVKTAYLRGLITLPVADSTQQNALDYKALFQNGDGFQFTMTPKGPIRSSFFAGGEFTLKPSSYLKVALKDKSSFDIKLTGGFGWNDVSVGPVKNVTLTADFQNMAMSWVEGGSFGFNIGTWSFASPQKKVAKIPVTIDNIKYVSKPAQPGEVLRGAVNFEVIVNLNEKFAGRTKLEVTGAIERPAARRFKPKYIDARIDSIGLYIKTSAVIVDGFVKFFQDDPMYGNGFSGRVKASFTSAQTEVTATARFGTTSYNAGSPYRYWYVDAKVILPPPGITFLPGYALYGAGLAAWQRMNVSPMPALNAAQVASTNTPQQATASGATFTPSTGIGFGFAITGVLGTAPDPKRFNADVTFAGQFSPSGGLVTLSISGEFWGMAKLTERATAPIKGAVSLQYTHPTRVFHMTALAHINKDPVVSGPAGVGMVVHVEGKTGIWYVKIGEPSNRNVVKVYGVNTESYVMFGKNITAPAGFSSATNAGLASVGVSLAAPPSSVIANAVSGNGVALGVGAYFDTGQRNRHLFGRVYLRSRASGGFELNLSALRYPDNAVCSGGAGIEGLNHWYMQGNVAAWVTFNVQIFVEMKDGTISNPCLFCCKNNHPNGCPFDLVDIKIGGALQGGFPKPTWLQGSAAGTFNFFDGNVSGSFQVDVDYGTPCWPVGGPEAGPAGVAEDAAAAQEAALIKSAYPANNSNSFDVKDRPRLLYGFTPNQTFDVVESQGDAAGTTVHRTFQARYTVTMRKQGPNGFGNPLTIQTAANTLGEHLVLLKGNMVNMAQPKNNMSNDGEGGPKPAMDLGPNLDSASVYKVSVTATLYELKTNNYGWTIARKKNNDPVTETVETQFATVAPPLKPKLMNENKKQSGN